MVYHGNDPLCYFYSSHIVHNIHYYTTFSSHHCLSIQSSMFLFETRKEAAAVYAFHLNATLPIYVFYDIHVYNIAAYYIYKPS